jgi:hypothetical protein
MVSALLAWGKQWSRQRVLLQQTVWQSLMEQGWRMSAIPPIRLVTVGQG